MGANAQTTVQKFVDGAVLTAAQQNFSAATGVPVFATTVTRDAAFGGANKVLAEGQTCYLESTNVVQYYDGAAWATVGPTAASGLVLITAQTIGSAVSSVVVAGCFSSTYDNYKVVIAGGVGSASALLNLIFGAAVTAYYFGGVGTQYNGAVTAAVVGNNVAFLTVGGVAANGVMSVMEIQNPNLARQTTVAASAVLPNPTNNALTVGGFHDATTQHTGFTITPASGTLTGGVIRVYGYQNS